VFDPHVPNDGVIKSNITSVEQLESLIQTILDRVEKAAARGSGPDTHQ
jgi:hypothetical protein